MSLRFYTPKRKIDWSFSLILVNKKIKLILIIVTCGSNSYHSSGPVNNHLYVILSRWICSIFCRRRCKWIITWSWLTTITSIVMNYKRFLIKIQPQVDFYSIIWNCWFHSFIQRKVTNILVFSFVISIHVKKPSWSWREVLLWYAQQTNYKRYEKFHFL